jgi:hypothetical protein
MWSPSQIGHFGIGGKVLSRKLQKLSCFSTLQHGFLQSLLEMRYMHSNPTGFQGHSLVGAGNFNNDSKRLVVKPIWKMQPNMVVVIELCQCQVSMLRQMRDSCCARPRSA